VFLAGRGKSINFWFGYIYAILLFTMFIQKHLYSSMLLQPISLGFTILGHYRWTHPAKDEENKKRELKVTVLNNRERLMFVGGIVLFTVAWGFFMQWISGQFPEVFPPARRPFLDACVMGAMFTAQYLSAQKKLDCWGAWIIVNTTNIILYVSAGLVFMPIVSALYWMNAILGFNTWKKEWRETKC
jgi:nicotinamide mononucleotide transporter